MNDPLFLAEKRRCRQTFSAGHYTTHGLEIGYSLVLPFKAESTLTLSIWPLEGHVVRYSYGIPAALQLSD